MATATSLSRLPGSLQKVVRYPVDQLTLIFLIRNRSLPKP
jgi:hypothetical protein